MNIRLSLAAGALLLSLAAGARTWTLEECVSHALAHNLTIKAQDSRVTGAELEITQAKDAFLPTVDGSASQSYNLGRGLTAENTYANRNTSNTQWGIGANVPLFQGMRALRRLELSKLSLQQMLYDADAARDDVTLNVISQYLQVLYCKEVERSAESQVALSAYEVERLNALAQAGKIAEADVYDADAQAAQDRLQLVSAQNDTRTALVTLANLLLLPSSHDMDVAPLTNDDPLLPLPDAIYESALQVNNSILSGRQSILVADKNIQLARTGYLPTLSLNAGTGSSYYTVSGLPSETFRAQMRHNLSTYVGFSLRVPIFDAFSTRNSVRSARLQHYSARLDLERRESELYKTIQLAYYQAKGARDRYKTSAETLLAAQRSFDATRDKLALGRATALEFEQAKAKLYRTEVTRIQSHYEYLLRHRILQFYAKGSI